MLPSIITLAILLLHLADIIHAYSTLNFNKIAFQYRKSTTRYSTQMLSLEELELTPVLTDYAERLRKVTDDKLRYQQLLFLAAKCPPMNDALKVDANKVPGCLSVVHVHARRDEHGKIHYMADSDSQLTKGLVVMLVNGLSGHTAEEILKVKPEFIQYAGVGKSLTPGRNNGFLNMLNLMKQKAKQLSPEAAAAVASEVATAAKASAESTDSAAASSDYTTAAPATGAASAPAAAAASTPAVAVSIDTSAGGPVYASIAKKLSMLQPVQLSIEDESHKHAGHAGIAGSARSDGSGETHFKVSIVAACFAGLSRVQRHQMIYTLLKQELDEGVHALSINAKTPDEA